MANRSELNGQPRVLAKPPAAPTPQAAAATTAKPPATNSNVAPSLPKSWDDIRPGALVIAHEAAADGWWEAIVTELTGDTLTLKWRDYPKQPTVARQRRQVALLYSGK